MKRILGAALLAAPFLVIAGVLVSQVGVEGTLIAFATACVTMALIWAGLALLIP